MAARGMDVRLYDLPSDNGLSGVMNILTLSRNIINCQHSTLSYLLRRPKHPTI